MGKHSFFGGLAKLTVAAAAVTGVCYLFKDEIKGSKAYQELEMDDKIQKAKTAIKDTTATIKEKAQEKAPWLSNEDEIIDDDEIILNNAEPSERDYVPLSSDAAAFDAAAKESADDTVPYEEEPIPSEEEKVSDNDADTILM